MTDFEIGLHCALQKWRVNTVPGMAIMVIMR